MSRVLWNLVTVRWLGQANSRWLASCSASASSLSGCLLVFVVDDVFQLDENSALSSSLTIFVRPRAMEE